MFADNGSEHPISTINIRLSSYLDKLAGQIFDLEEAISHAVDTSSSAEPQTITSLQSLDFLRQSLEDLAIMTLLIGQENKVSLTAPEIEKISQKLKLKVTCAVLEGQQHDDFGTKKDSADDLDLF
ncbi:hypothetical protein [Roseobacter sinensis]|uniref:Chemotaxis protein CheZ n=1 Tax=Roseobacter sinensis TaxID=2931391 RepID=A0ABT3BER2_9RHOB|nr:hypothetical protein [Roseobacter sp. WL0113]MCV3272055.1 hypothetical protein [Roseobacter sp. WL0113]